MGMNLVSLIGLAWEW